MKGDRRILTRGIALAALATAAALTLSARAQQVEQVQVQQQAIELDSDQIFDGGLFVDGEVEIVNGHIVVRDNSKKDAEAPAPDPAGDQILELTDGSQLHGKLVTLGKGEITWQRADAGEPLTFAPQDVKRVVLDARPVGATNKADATVKMQGSDWLAGELLEMRDGKFTLRVSPESKVEIPRDRVEWLSLTPAGAPPPDSYDGPVGPMGMAGWDAGDVAGSWDYADGALVAKAVAAISRRFAALPEKLDLQFTAGDGGTSNRGLTLWLQPGNNVRGYTKGSCYLRFQAGTVSANIFNGEQMKNFSANIDEGRDEKKVTRYRILHDPKEGRMVIIINGKQIADWKLPKIAAPNTSGTFSWQPSYWSSNIAWTLAGVRVQPWDGTLDPDPKDEEKSKDLLTSGETRKTGALQEISPTTVKIEGTEIPRKDPIFLRLAASKDQDPPTGGVARVWLSSRGEFDVTGIGFRDGVLKVRTSFAGDLALPASSLRAIEFPHKAAAAQIAQVEGGDTIIFKNGDQLRGTLLGASHDKPVRWKPVKGTKPVEFASDRLAGILLAPRKDAPSGSMGAAACFHNGDWIAGQMLGLDKDALHLSTGMAGDLRIDRHAVRTVYFAPVDEEGKVGEAPVWDGASQRDAWIRGAAVPGYWGGEGRKQDNKRANLWRYLDGSFTLLAGGNRNNYGNGPNLGRIFDNLPNKVELSFDLSTGKGPAGYAFQFFFDDSKPGLMVQGGWDSAYLYDMSPRRNGAVFNNPQQVDFGEKIGSDGNRRHFRFLGDRENGRLWMFVNGQFVGQLNRRGSGENVKPGKGIAIMPQPMSTRVTVSNIWVAPWSGALPELPKTAKPDAPANAPAPAANGAPDEGAKPAPEPVAAAKPDTKPEAKPDAKPDAPAPAEFAPDAIALNNGDETMGTVLSATAKALRVKCDVGELDIPMNRATMIEFGGKAPAPSKGIRLRLASKGAITVQTMRIEDGKVFCQSAAAGDLSFPLSALSEVVFQPNDAKPFEGGPAANESSGTDENGAGGIFLNGNGVRARILVR